MTNKAKPSHKKFRLSPKDREYLTTNLALLMKAAVPIGEALDSLAKTTKSKLFKSAVVQMLRDVDNGLPLWKVLDRSGVVSEQTLALARLGEESGNLAANLQVAAKQEAKQRLFRSKVRSALLYPTFVLSLMTLVGVGVAWFLLPKLSETFTQLRVQLPLITRIFLDLGIFLKNDGLWAVPSMLVGIAVSFYIIFAAPKTKQFGNALLFHMPGVSQLLYQVEIARFGYLLSTLLNAGLSVTRALDLLEHSTSTPRYQKLYRYLRQALDDGYSFRTALPGYKAAEKLLPATVQQLLIAGEHSGSLAETLATVGADYEAKADISTDNLEVILEPILLVIVALGVLGLAVAIILPIYKLTSGLSS